MKGSDRTLKKMGRLLEMVGDCWKWLETAGNGWRDHSPEKVRRMEIAGEQADLLTSVLSKMKNEERKGTS